MNRLRVLIPLSILAILVIGGVASRPPNANDSSAAGPILTQTVGVTSKSGSSTAPSATTETSRIDVTPTLSSAATPQPPQAFQAPPTATPRSTTPAEEVEFRTVGEPARLQIPAIGVDAAVEAVGVDEQGNMDVPSTYTDVGWFQPGARPGVPGNAVIDGHLDSTTGPAVFYRLAELTPGAEIIVTTTGGEQLRFVVVEVASFTTTDAPINRIFGPSFDVNLNLITCEGTFDFAERQYDQRLVVYATLQTP